MSKFNEEEVNTNIYMAYQNDEPGQVGNSTFSVFWKY